MKGCNNNNEGTFSVVNSSVHEVPLYSHYKETAGCQCIKYENFGGTETCMMRAQCGPAMDENGLKPYQKDARHSFKMCLVDKKFSLRNICPAGYPCNFPDESQVPGSPGLRQDHEGTQFRYEGRTNGGPPQLASPANPHLNGIPAAASCNTGHGGQNCKQHPNLQLCLKGTPGTKGRHWICLYNRDKKWVPAGGGTKARADRALAWEQQNASAPPPPPAAPPTVAPPTAAPPTAAIPQSEQLVRSGQEYTFDALNSLI